MSKYYGTLGKAANEPELMSVQIRKQSHEEQQQQHEGSGECEGNQMIDQLKQEKRQKLYEDFL